MSLFSLCAAVAGAAMILGPLVAAIVWTTLGRPRARTGSWLASWPGFLAGAGLMLLVLIAKPFLHGAPPAEEAWHGWPLVLASARLGLFAAVAEEAVRFTVGLALFRRARSTPAIPLAVMFGLGWGGLESLVIGIQRLDYARGIVQSMDAAQVPLPALPLVVGFERVSAILFHVAVCVFLVEASRSSRLRALAIALGATIAHATLDAVLHWYAVPIEHAFAAGDYPRVLGDSIEMEAIFLAGAVMMLMAARRTVSSSPGAAASPGS